MEVTFNLHPAGHECAPGGMNCGVFGESFYGIRASDRQYITFAMGTGAYTGVMLYATGLLSDEEFRQADTYRVAMVNKEPPCLHKKVFGTILYYQYAEVGRGLMPLRGTQLPDGEVVYIDMADALNQ